ncbi:MAG TPA: hypothetical protein VGN52_24045 [Burkholderiales bacterium]|jgi:hypothetical protein
MSAQDDSGYQLSLEGEGGFVHYRSLASARNSAEMGQRLSAALELGRVHGVARIMFDSRGTSFQTGIAAQYEYAYNQARRLGLTREWRIAMLVTPGDRSYDFMETAFVNSGYITRLFSDYQRAVDWLCGRAEGDSGDGASG